MNNLKKINKQIKFKLMKFLYKFKIIMIMINNFKIKYNKLKIYNKNNKIKQTYNIKN